MFCSVCDERSVSKRAVYSRRGVRVNVPLTAEIISTPAERETDITQPDAAFHHRQTASDSVALA